MSTPSSTLTKGFDALKEELNTKLSDQSKMWADYEIKYREAANQCEEIYKKEPHRSSDIHSICLSCLSGLSDQIRTSCTTTLDVIISSSKCVKDLEAELNLLSLNMDIVKEKFARRRIGSLTCTKVIDKKSCVINSNTNMPVPKMTRLKLRFEQFDDIGCSGDEPVFNKKIMPMSNYLTSTSDLKERYTLEEVTVKEMETFNVSSGDVSVFWQNYTKTVEGGKLVDRAINFEESSHISFKDAGQHNFADTMCIADNDSESIDTYSNFMKSSKSSDSKPGDEGEKANYAKKTPAGSSNVSIPVPTASARGASTNTAKGIVLYPYVANNSDELTLKKGDTVEVLQKFDDGWAQGRLNGVIGYFPYNFIEVKDS